MHEVPSSYLPLASCGAADVQLDLADPDVRKLAGADQAVLHVIDVNFQAWGTGTGVVKPMGRDPILNALVLTAMRGSGYFENLNAPHLTGIPV